MKVYTKLAHAIRGCDTPDKDIARSSLDEVADIVKRCLPHGSGFDCGCSVPIERKWKNRIIINTDYHYMNDDGYYDGWYRFRIVVTPGFSGIDVKVHGRDRDGLKEYVGDTIYDALTADYNE